MSEIRIIHEPKAKTMLRSISELGITALIWSLWLYLLMPMLGIIMWLVSGHIVYMRLFEEGGLDIFLGMIRHMGLIVLICFTAIQGWSYYNLFRFGKSERRKKTELTGFEASFLSEFHHIPTTLLTELSVEREIVWPPARTGLTDVYPWLGRKQRHLAGLHVEDHVEDHVHIHDIHLTRFHEVHVTGEPSIFTAIYVVIVIVFLIAGLIVFALMP